MKKITLTFQICTLLLLSISTFYAQTPTWVNAFDKMYVTARDAAGNMYHASSFEAPSTTIGGEVLATGSTNMVIAKFNPDGSMIWFKSPQDNNYSQAYKLIVNSSGDIYVYGKFISEFSIDNITLTSSGEAVFLLKLNSQGEIIWAKAGNSASGGFIDPSDMALDGDGNIILSGNFFDSEEINFDTITLENIGLSNFFVVKYTQAGNPLWAQKGGGNGWANSSAQIAIDTEDNIFIAGNYDSHEYTIGNMTILHWNENPINGECDIFFTKFSHDGLLQWVKSFGGNSGDNVNSIVADSQDNIIMAGTVASEALVFDDFTLSENLGGDAFLTKFDNDGNAVWAKSFGGDSGDAVNKIITDSDSNIYATGYFFSGTFSSEGVQLFNEGISNSFVLKLTGLGNIIWGTNIAGTGINYAGNIVLHTEDNTLTVSGSFMDNVSIGETTFVTPPDTFGLYTGVLSIGPLDISTYVMQDQNVYPNPAKDILNITGYEASDYKIIDISGRIISNGTFNKGQVNVSALPSGIYILNINNTTTKFIKE